jgi:hypothetical protein
MFLFITSSLKYTIHITYSIQVHVPVLAIYSDLHIVMYDTCTYSFTLFLDTALIIPFTMFIIFYVTVYFLLFI